MGSVLAKKSLEDFGQGLGLIVSKRSKKKVYVSFRGHPLDKDFNCEELASYFEGGGHKMASGCILDKEIY